MQNIYSPDRFYSTSQHDNFQILIKLTLYSGLNVYFFKPEQIVLEKRCYVGQSEFQTRNYNIFLKKSGHQDFALV